MSDRAFTADSIGMALGDAINLLLYGAGVGVDVDHDRRLVGQLTANYGDSALPQLA
jgi:hypothetical protein